MSSKAVPTKKPAATKRDSSPTKKSTKLVSKPQENATSSAATTTTAAAITTAITDNATEVKVVKQVKMKEVIPEAMQKLQDLTRWPIVMDEVGNLKTFYRMNELIIDFNTPLTIDRVKVSLQRAFFGLSFKGDGSIDDHRQFSIPNEVNRLIAVIMEEKPIEQCVEELRKVCNQLHPKLFDSVFVKANVKESGRDNLDDLFIMTQTPDEIHQTDYYQFGAKCRSEIPFTCVWITHLSEIPTAYDNMFGPRFKLE